MRNRYKLTKEQIRSMYDHLEGLAFADKRKRNSLKMFYHMDTPKDVYVKYTSYGVEPDNSIYSEETIECIKPDGSKMNCATQFDNLKQKMQFDSGLLEIDLDAKGNLIFV
jgi:hypothetical protein